MSLTRTHFQAVAEILRTTKGNTVKEYKENLLANFIGYFHSENSNFDSQRFIEAVERDMKELNGYK